MENKKYVLFCCLDVTDADCPKEEPKMGELCSFSEVCKYNEICCCEKKMQKCYNTTSISCDGKTWGSLSEAMIACTKPCDSNVH